MTTQANQGLADEFRKKAALNETLEDLGWGVLLITIGTIWLLPDKQLPPGSWLIAAGLIILGINAIRYFNGITMRGFSLVVGFLALFAGMGALFRLDLPLLAIALILIGACILLKPLVEKKSISPAGKGWCCCGDEEDREREQMAGR